MRQCSLSIIIRRIEARVKRADRRGVFLWGPGEAEESGRVRQFFYGPSSEKFKNKVDEGEILWYAYKQHQGWAALKGPVLGVQNFKMLV